MAGKGNENRSGKKPPKPDAGSNGATPSQAATPPQDDKRYTPVWVNGTKYTIDFRDPKRSLVRVHPAEHEVIDQVVEMLASEVQNLYQRAANLVRVRRQSAPVGVHHNEGLAIERLPAAGLRTIVTTACQFWELKQYKDGPVCREIHPPDWLEKSIMARDDWPGIRHLEALVTTPVMRPDGSVLDEEGYDDKTGILYRPSTEFASILFEPTKEDAIAARDRILDIFCDFPFETEADLSVVLAAILSIAARTMYEGATPLFLVEKNAPGTGASLIINLIGMLMTGGPMALTPNTNDDEELRKRISSMVLEGTQLVCIDNVEGTVGAPSLDMCLTTTNWTDRSLGKNEMIRGKNKIIWFATGNNPDLRTDTARRTLSIRLEAKTAHPEDRDRAQYKHQNVEKYVRENRASLVADVLTMLRAWVVDGKKGSENRISMGMGSFEGWEDVIRNCVLWLDMPDPALTRERIRKASDRDIEKLTSLMISWFLWTGEEYRPMNDLLDMLKREEGDQRVRGTTPAHPELRAAVDDLSGGKYGQLPSVAKMTSILRRFRNKAIDQGLRFERADERKNYGFEWRVKVIDEELLKKHGITRPELKKTEPTNNSSSSGNNGDREDVDF